MTLTYINREGSHAQVAHQSKVRGKQRGALLFLFVAHSRVRLPFEMAIMPIHNISQGLFTWRWGTPGRYGNPLRWGKKITLLYTQSYNPAIPGCTFSRLLNGRQASKQEKGWQSTCFGDKCSSTLMCCSCCNLQCCGFLLLPLIMMQSNCRSEFCANLMCYKSDPDQAGYPTYHEISQYAQSIQTLDGRLCNFGIYYEDDAISVENVKEVVKKELEGPEKSSLRIQLFVLAPRRQGRSVRSLAVRSKEKRLYSQAKEGGTHKKIRQKYTFFVRLDQV